MNIELALPASDTSVQEAQLRICTCCEEQCWRSSSLWWTHPADAVFSKIS